MDNDTRSLIAGIKKSYKRSNLVDHDLGSMLGSDVGCHVGYVLEHSPNISTKMYQINFDPVENMYLNKLVHQQTLDQRIIMRKEDFFKGIVFLDYITTVCNLGSRLYENLYTIAQQLERMNRLVDPDLAIVVHQAGIHYVYQAATNIHEDFRQSCYSVFRSQKRDVAVDVMSRPTPLYEAVGSKLVSLIQNEDVKRCLGSAKSAIDIKALVCCDAVFPFLPEDKKPQVLEKLEGLHFYQASIIGIGTLGKTGSDTWLSDYMQHLVQSQGGRT